MAAPNPCPPARIASVDVSEVQPSVRAAASTVRTNTTLSPWGSAFGGAVFDGGTAESSSVSKTRIAGGLRAVIARAGGDSADRAVRADVLAAAGVVVDGVLAGTFTTVRTPRPALQSSLFHRSQRRRAQTRGVAACSPSRACGRAGARTNPERIATSGERGIRNRGGRTARAHYGRISARTSGVTCCRLRRDTAPGEPTNDDSRTIPANPRLAPVAALAEAVKAASLVGAMRTAQVASRALHELLGASSDADRGKVVDLVSVKERSPR